VFHRSGSIYVAWKDSGFTKAEDWRTVTVTEGGK
jgi:hypothetical protein